MKTFLTLLAALLTVTGCAHSRAEKELDSELKNEAPVKEAAQLDDEAGKAIANEANLTVEQRAGLREIHQSIHDQNAQLREQSLKLRMRLIKEVFATRYDGEEVAVIKKRLEEVEKQRLAVLFTAVDRANVILGHQEGRKQRFMQDFFQWEEFR